MASSDIKMMSSLALNFIRSASNSLERSGYSQRDDGLITKFRLKNLELFVLCAGKLSNDVQLKFYDFKVYTLACLLQRFHHELPRIVPLWDYRETFVDFKDAIANFYEEIGVWYNTSLVSLPRPTFDQVTDIIDSVLDNLEFIFFNPNRTWKKSQLIEPMIEKITFLRNFIRFATLRSVEPPQLLDNLLAHIQAVAVDAAHVSYLYVLGSGEGFVFKVQSNVSVLPQMIKAVDTQVDEAYTQALTSSKLSTKLLSPTPEKDHDPSVIMKDFIDSLLWNLWERLHMDTPIVISIKSELQLVYGGLRVLRIMLQEQPNKFDKKIGELTRVVICDAGIITFSLYQRDMGMAVPDSGLLQRINRITQIVKGKDFSIPDLLQRISRIRQRVEGKDLSIPDLLRRVHRPREQVGGNDLPRTNELGFIDFVLENLLEMTSSKSCYGLQSQFRMIHDELSTLRCSLGKIEGLRNEQKDLEALWNAGVEVAYRVEFFIDQLVFGDFQGSSSTSFGSALEDILKEVKSINCEIHPVAGIKMKKVSTTPNPVPFQNRAPAADEIVGFDDNITSVIDRLTRGSKQLKMVAIVGMPGTGKTTLATKVFHHPSVTHHFYVRISCCVSQSFRKKSLLLELSSLVPNTDITMSEQDLTEKLRKHLKGKRYLIFLDDTWDIEAWDSLEKSFPDDLYGSRILVTSRVRDAVPQAMLDEEPHFLNPLTEDQSWELLQKKFSPTKGWSLSLSDVGRQIAANCKGLPLAVVVAAGLLASMEPEDWCNILEDITAIANAEPCMNTFESSYKHLPGQLKECFLYFGLFPEDHEVPVKRLIRLWIAEGFVRKTESKSLEVVARDYISELARRSLVIVSQERSRGGVKACRIHDLLHDFCRTKAKQENFSQLLKGNDQLLSSAQPRYMRRLCVHFEQNHFKSLRQFCPRLHSLLFFAHGVQRGEDRNISFIIPRYSRLRVLDIAQYHLPFWIGIPSDIRLVLQLKYLSVSGDISNIPPSIGCLTNLETFILHSYKGEVSLPDTFWNLQKLRHVAIKGSFRLEFKNLERYPELCELQSCSTAVIRHGGSIEKLVRKFPNILKLRCHLDLNEIEILIPDSLRQLESLHLSLWWSQLDCIFEFDLPDSLRKLSLTDFWLHQSHVSRIGKLPNLEVLKFCGVDFHENKWDMVEGEFSKLRFLKLNISKIVEWTASDDSDDQFPCLEKLVLEHCNCLEEIPCCFESIDTLEMVDVRYCSDTVNNFFRRIQDELVKSFLLRISEFEDSEDPILRV